MEIRADAAVGQIIAVEVARRLSAAGEVVVELWVGRGGVAVALGGAGTACRESAVTRGVRQGFDAADDVAKVVGGRALSAQGGGVRGRRRFDLSLIHSIVITIQIPGRAAHDAGGPIIGVGGS